MYQHQVEMLVTAHGVLWYTGGVKRERRRKCPGCGKDVGLRGRCPYCGGSVRLSVVSILKYGTNVLLFGMKWRVVGMAIATGIIVGVTLTVVGRERNDIGWMMRGALAKHWPWLSVLAALCIGMSSYRHGKAIPQRDTAWRVLEWVLYYGAIAGMTAVLFLALNIWNMKS